LIGRHTSNDAALGTREQIARGCRDPSLIITPEKKET
jgi:hypothetical protein